MFFDYIIVVKKQKKFNKRSCAGQGWTALGRGQRVKTNHTSYKKECSGGRSSVSSGLAYNAGRSRSSSDPKTLAFSRTVEFG